MLWREEQLSKKSVQDNKSLLFTVEEILNGEWDLQLTGPEILGVLAIDTFVIRFT